MRRDFGKPTTLGNALGSMMRGIEGGSERLLQVRVFGAWEQVAGETVLSHTTGAHIRNGELVVLVDSNIWATELTALSGRYKEALNGVLGKGTVRTIRFNVSSKVQREKEQAQAEKAEEDSYSEDVVEAIPLTAQERAQVEASAATIADADLRAVVIRATIADLEWKKGLLARKQP